MSVLIKTMEMPKNCGECQLCHIENFNLWCCLTGQEDIFYDAMPEWCPLEKPKKGKWIDAVLPNDSGGLRVQVCDQCNTFFPLAYTGGGHNFCPNCGADMRGEDE